MLQSSPVTHPLSRLSNACPRSAGCIQASNSASPLTLQLHSPLRRSSRCGMMCSAGTMYTSGAQGDVESGGVSLQATDPIPELPRLDAGEDVVFDVIVAGGGPSGLALAAAASESGLTVGVIDPTTDIDWINNYGVWVDEFEAIGFGDCLSHVWQNVDVVFDSSSPVRTLERPYGQVDRKRLKRRLLNTCLQNGVGFLKGKVKKVEGDTVYCSDGMKLRAILVIDATGYSRKLLNFDSPAGDLDSSDVSPGYQVTYGMLAKVKSHPYKRDHMLLMDWSDDHFSPALFERNAVEPSFLYAMPFTDDLVFFEETSLVDRPAVKSEDLKERLHERLAALGVEVVCVLEEERAMIPMGGSLPVIPQPVLGMGGSCGMVHPSTGYMIARALEQAPQIVAAVKPYIEQAKAGQIDSESLAENCWGALWPSDELRQWNFMNLGMQILCELSPVGLRDFFKAFFALDHWLWGGYLSWRLSGVECLVMGVSLLAVAPLHFRVRLVWTSLPFLPEFVSAWLGLVLWQKQSSLESISLRRNWKEAASSASKLSNGNLATSSVDVPVKEC